MANNEPSLSELSHIDADPERGSGTPAVTIDNSEMVRELNQNARFKAENDWRKYNLFLGNLKDSYKDADLIAGMETMDADKPMLQEKMGKFLQAIAENPRALSQGGPKAAEIQKMHSDLLQTATKSKQHNLFDKAMTEAFARNPQWSTDKNKAMQESFRKGDINSRRPYQIEMPAIVDYGKMVDAITKSATQPFGKVYPSADGKFMINESGTVISRDQFLKKGLGTYDLGVDDNGVPVKKFAKQMFDELPAYKKDEYKDEKDPVRTFWQKTLEDSFGSDKDIISTKKVSEKENKYEEMNQKLHDDLIKIGARLAGQRELVGLRGNWQERVAMFKKDNGISAPHSDGSGLNDFISHSILVAKAKPASSTYSASDGTIKSEHIADLPSDIVKAFEITETSDNPRDKGKKISRLPDRTTVDDDGNTKVIFYQRDRSTGKPIEKNGKIAVDVDKTKTYTPDDLKMTYAKHYGLTKSLEMSNEYLMENGLPPTLNGNVEKYWEHRVGKAEKAPEKKEEHHTTTTKMYQYKGKSYSHEAIEKKAKLSGYTVEEYLKALGIK